MRRYDDPIEVRLGLVRGQEAPAHFVWRRALWSVRAVIRYWVETDAWWELPGVATLFNGGDHLSGGDHRRSDEPVVAQARLDLLGEQELWRVEAQRGRTLRGAGIFDLAFDTGHGQWRLVRCMD
ncbi:MAG: DUF6504 family protein [Nocardioidaceae bacterium]